MFWNFCGGVSELWSNTAKTVSFQLCFCYLSKNSSCILCVLLPSTPASRLSPLHGEPVWFQELWSVFHLSVFCFRMDGLLCFQAGFLISFSYLVKKSHYLATISLNPSQLQTWYHLTLRPLYVSCLFLTNSCVCSFPSIHISLCLTVSGLQLV